MIVAYFFGPPVYKRSAVEQQKLPYMLFNVTISYMLVVYIVP